MENTATVPTGLDVSRLLKSQSLSASMRTNLERADIDNDGIIDVEELVKILESESALRRERKLLRWIVMALGIACILIVAAVVGLTYAVVHLSKDTAVQNNVLVSKADSQPLSTGSLQVSSALKDLYKVDNLAQLQGLDQIMMPFEDGISLFGIEGVHLVPGKSVRFDTNRENLTILVTEDGISVSGGSSNSTGRRRLLDEDTESIIATGTAGVNMQGDLESGKPFDYCEAHEECESNDCVNLGIFLGVVLSKGRCAPNEKVKAGGECVYDVNCESDACGRRVSHTSVTKPEKECCATDTVMAGGLNGFEDYCVGQTKAGEDCWVDTMCEAGTKCKDNAGGTGFTTGTCSTSEKKASESCDSNWECASNACGRPTADDGAALVCCPSGATSTYGGYDYCTGMAVGATCWADDQCQTDYCQGNGGGIQKGKCQSTSKANKETCTNNRECASDACGRLSADDAHTNLYLCCDAITTYASADYCKNLPVGAMCWTDAMCLTGLCKGNLSGLQRGLCSMG
jgi:hypothetical protein